MTQERLQEFAYSKGWKWLGTGMAGICQNYPFATRFQTGKDGTLTTVFTASGRFPIQVGRRLKKELPQGCSLSWKTNPVLVCSGQDGGLLEMHAAAMELVAAALQEVGANIPNRCPLCKEDNCDALALLGQVYTPVHWACCEGKPSFSASRALGGAVRERYTTGLAGALLGGIAASVPAALSASIMRLFAFLFVLIPLGTYFGYRLFRGRRNRAAGTITLVVSLLMPFLVVQTVFYRTVAAAYDVLPGIWDTVRLYFTLYTPAQIALAMIIPYLFLLLGLWMTFRVMIRTSKRQVVDASDVLDSMIPFRNRDEAS